MTQQQTAARVHLACVGAVALTGALLPLYVVRYHVGPLPTTVLENLVGLSALLYVASLLTERRLPRFGTPYDIPVVLLLLAGITGIFAAPDHLRAVGIYRAYFVEAIALFYVAVDVMRTKSDLRIVLAGVVFGGAWMAIGQIVDFTMNSLHHSIVIGAAPAFLNTSSNSVALYLEPPLAFAAGVALFDESPRLRWLGRLAAALILAGALMTLSRGFYGALLVPLAMAVFSLPSWRARFASTAAILLAGAVFLSIPLIRARLATVQFSILLRDSLYQQAFHVLSQRPIFGAGISGYPLRAAPFRPPTQTVELYPHNLWLTTWSELGLLGVVAFAVIFFGLVWRGLATMNRTTGLTRAVIWGAVGALLLYTVHGMVDSPYWKNDLSVEFWFIAALEVAAIRLVATSGAGSASGARPRSEVGPT